MQGARRHVVVDPPIGAADARPADRAAAQSCRQAHWARQRLDQGAGVLFRSHHAIAVYRAGEWAERGDITLQAAAQIMDVSVMTASRMVRQGIIMGQQLCEGAPWVIKAEDMAAYGAQRRSKRPLTSDPAQESIPFQ